MLLGLAVSALREGPGWREQSFAIPGCERPAGQVLDSAALIGEG